MKNTDEYLYNEHPLADVVPLIETFIDKADYDEDTAKKILGLLVEGGDTAQQETISDALDEYSIEASAIESTSLDTEIDSDSTVRDKVRSMLERDYLDETASTVPDIVIDYNRNWTIEKTKDRKEELVREMLATLAFEGEYEETDSDEANFGINLRETIEDDYEKRVGLRYCPNQVRARSVAPNRLRSAKNSASAIERRW
jgi:hypothetical protein